MGCVFIFFLKMPGYQLRCKLDFGSQISCLITQLAALSLLEPLSNLVRYQEGKLGLGAISRGVISSLSESSWNSVDHQPKSWSDLYMLTAANNMNGNRTNTNLIQHESSLFSSSLSEIFSRKLQSLRNDAPTHLPSFKVSSDHEEEPLGSLEEIEEQTIGNLLPDKDDLFSGVMGPDTPANRGDELEDFDLFSSGGGMELEGDDCLGVGQGNSDIVGASNGSIVGGHPSPFW